jgi:hypothetical protein
VSVVLEWIIVCGFVRFVLTIVVSVFHRFMASDSPFGIFKPSLHTLYSFFTFQTPTPDNLVGEY